MIKLLNKNPFYTPRSEYGTKATADKGKQIMEGLLLNQYHNSPDLKEYYMAFIAELDLLFLEIDNVYNGRLIQNAVGRQLDVIGIILGQTRSVVLDKLWFGFDGAAGVDGFASIANPANGGLFRSINQGEGVVTPLGDLSYRRILLAKAVVCNRHSADLSLAYYVVSIILGRVPSVFELVDIDTVFYEQVDNGNFDLNIDGWVQGTTGTGANLAWAGGKLEVTPPFGENGYAEQILPVGTRAGNLHNLKLDWDNEGLSKCRILVGTELEVDRYYSNFGQGGSGSLDVNFTPDLEEPVYLRLGSIEQNTWSTYDNVSVERVNLVGKRAIELILSRKDASTQEVQLINYMAKYFVPTGITLTIRRV